MASMHVCLASICVCMHVHGIHACMRSLHMCVCVCVWVYVCMCLETSIQICMYACDPKYVCMHAWHLLEIRFLFFIFPNCLFFPPGTFFVFVFFWRPVEIAPIFLFLFCLSAALAGREIFPSQIRNSKKKKNLPPFLDHDYSEFL
jgi:hypothetical protein